MQLFLQPWNVGLCQQKPLLAVMASFLVLELERMCTPAVHVQGRLHARLKRRVQMRRACEQRAWIPSTLMYVCVPSQSGPCRVSMALSVHTCLPVDGFWL